MSASVSEIAPPVKDSSNSSPTSVTSLEKKEETGMVVVSDRMTQWVSQWGAALGISQPASSGRPRESSARRRPMKARRDVDAGSTGFREDAWGGRAGPASERRETRRAQPWVDEAGRARETNSAIFRARHRSRHQSSRRAVFRPLF